MSEQDAAGPPPPPKPRLKINVSRSSSFATGAASATPVATSAAVFSTPSATPTEGPRKVKLKINASQPSTPLETPDGPPKQTKAGRQPKPTMKLVESKKRPSEDDDEGDGVAIPRDLARMNSKAAKIRIRQTPKSGPPALIVKTRGKPPTHPPGDGYDSEASDRERDPAIEEQFILRMQPGEHCDYVRWAMENGKLGISPKQGGADIYIKFFEEETRRGIVTVKGQMFAAVMVDLPTITESLKTWDKKSFMKSADICQMLLVFKQVKDEAEARKVPLPGPVDTHFKWPHGLTPPMHDAVNRRFAKTISRKEIEDKEAEVERLIQEDTKGTTRWEWVDDRKQDADDDYDAADEDAEGEVDDSIGYFNQAGEYAEDDNMDLEADLEAAFAEGDVLVETPATNMDTVTPMMTQGNTPAVVQQSIEMDELEEDDEDDDDDDDDESDLDDDARAERSEHQAVLSMISDLEKQLKQRQEELGRTTNRILRDRIEKQIKQYKSEIELKKGSIGMETDDYS